MDVRQIMGFLPHRYPFLLVDRVIKIEGEEEIHAVKNVTMNEEFFNGHFPGRPVMPGVLIIEALAQAAVLLVVNRLGKEVLEQKEFFFSSIENARFRKVVQPGDILNLHVRKLQSRSNPWKMQGDAIVNEEKVAEAVVSAMSVPKQ